MKTPILSDYLLQHFDKQSPGPSNQQLYRLLRKAILDRVLQVDARLPSSRDLARELATCRNTVLYAYDQLRAEGYIEGRSGSGTFVTDTAPQEGALNQTPMSHAPLGAQVAPILSRRGQELVAHAGAAAQQWGPFVPGVPDVVQFPHQTWSRIQKKVWRRPSPDSLTYAQGGGYLPLRVALADYLKVARCIDCSPEQVVITTGIHQSIDLCMRLLSDPGDLAWVEDPCYWGTRNLLRASGLNIRPVPVDAEGMCPGPADFAAVPRFIFLTPSHQYPLGMVMSLARRRLLLEYASRNDCWIIEDDYDSEFRYNGRPLAPLQGLDSAERVIYLGTFSKTLYPGLRVGYLVLPRALVRSFVTGVNELHRAGTIQTQATLAEFITEGFFTSHIRRMRTTYARRLGLLQQLINKRFDPSVVQTIGSDAGLHLVLQLPDYCNDQELAAKATHAGVAVRPLSLYYHDATRSAQGLLLGYACVHESQIAPAFEVLARHIEHELWNKPAPLSRNDAEYRASRNKAVL
ncbi:PLP-dependent aminotransferase family protein [Undibacterium arcticum]|uniref:PLP-dependent aminotransferase family protein n=1 Tax=Undibacterium arcticum TaxID=1762892 RepID=A0ABV7F7P7_9BURK